MNSLRRASLVSVGVFASLALGCETEPAGGPVGGDDTGSLFDYDVDLGAFTLEVRVREGRGEGAPLMTARCLLDYGHGTIEQGVGRDGITHFEVPDLVDRMSVVCAAGNGSGLLGFRQADLTDDTLELFIPIDDARRPLDGRLEGSIVGPHEKGDWFLVQATKQLGEPYEGQAHEYRLDVERDVPFGILALRYRMNQGLGVNEFGVTIGAWGAWSHRAIGRESTFDVDLSDTVEPTRVSGSIGLPRDTEGASPLWGDDMIGRATVYAKEAYGRAILGLATETSYAEGRRRMFYAAESYEGFYADEDVLTQFFVASKSSARAPYSVVLVEGYPPIGTMHEAFLDPPYVMQPTHMVPLEGALVRWAPDEQAPNALVVEDDAGAMLWLNLVEGAPELVVPRLPSRGLALGTVGVKGRMLATEAGQLDGFYDRVAASREFRFSR